MNSTHAAAYREMLQFDDVYPLPKSLVGIHNRAEHFMRNYGPRSFDAAAYALVLVVWELQFPEDRLSEAELTPVADLHECASRHPVMAAESSVDMAAGGDEDGDEEEPVEEPPELKAWRETEPGVDVVVAKAGKMPVNGKFNRVHDNGRLLVRLENMPAGYKQFNYDEVTLVESPQPA